jgi:hypothetical protein
MAVVAHKKRIRAEAHPVALRIYWLAAGTAVSPRRLGSCKLEAIVTCCEETGSVMETSSGAAGSPSRGRR